MEVWTEWTDMFYQDEHEHTLDLQKLAVDQAYVHVVNNEAGSVYLYFQNEDCIACPYKRLAEIPAESAVGVPVDTRKQVQLRLANYDYGDYVGDDYWAIDEKAPQPGVTPPPDSGTTAGVEGVEGATVPEEAAPPPMPKQAAGALDPKRWWIADETKSLGQFGVYQLKIGEPKVPMVTENPGGSATNETSMTATEEAPPVNPARQAAPEPSTAPEAPPTGGPIDLNKEDIKWTIEKEPVNIYSSLILMAAILIAVYWICKAVNRIWRSWKLAYRQRNMEMQAEPTSESTPLMDPMNGDRKNRPMTIEIFRGMAIVLMIFVGYGGGHYWFITPATWNGLHVGDFYSPMLTFALGVFIAYALDFQLKTKFATEMIVSRIIRRSIFLFFAGLFVQTVQGATFEHLRIPGLWQRLAFVYFVVAMLHFILHEEFEPRKQSGGLYMFQRSFADFIVLWRQWIVILFILAAYMGMVLGFNVPDCGHGYFGPGGLHENSTYENCTGGVSGLVDRYVLGENHLKINSTVSQVYHTVPFDEANILGTLTAIVQAFIGVQCGTIFLLFSKSTDRVLRWILWALAMTGLTLAMTWLSWDDSFIPINRSLNSLSFVTATCAFSFTLITLIYIVAEKMKFCVDFWKVFRYPGRNPLFLFLAHLIFFKMWPFHFGFEIMNTHFVLLFEACYATIFWILVSFYLNRKRIYFSV